MLTATNNLPGAIREALAPFAPAHSTVQFTEAELMEADTQIQRWKDGESERNQAQAERLEMADQRVRTNTGFLV